MYLGPDPGLPEDNGNISTDFSESWLRLPEMSLGQPTQFFNLKEVSAQNFLIVAHF